MVYDCVSLDCCVVVWTWALFMCFGLAWALFCVCSCGVVGSVHVVSWGLFMWCRGVESVHVGSVRLFVDYCMNGFVEAEFSCLRVSRVGVHSALVIRLLLGVSGLL